MRIRHFICICIYTILMSFNVLAGSLDFPELISPENGSVTSAGSIMLDYFISDPDADSLITNLYLSYDEMDNFNILETKTDQATESYSTYKLPENIVNGKYYWKVGVMDFTPRNFGKLSQFENDYSFPSRHLGNILNSSTYEFTIIDPLLEIKTNISKVYMYKNQSYNIKVTVSSLDHDFVEDLILIPIEPVGYGVTIDSGSKVINGLDVNGSLSFIYTVTARRSNEVNLGRDWKMKFKVTNGSYYEDTVLNINVTDQDPGKLFYVMTVDTEIKTGDTTGNIGFGGCEWSDGDDYFDYDESLLSMVNKTKAMQNVADPNGAKWTFHYCVGCIYSLRESEILSNSGNWDGIYEAAKKRLSSIVFEGSDLSPHTHLTKDSTHVNASFTWNQSEDAFRPNGAGSMGMDVIYPNIGNFTPDEYNLSKVSYIYDHLKFLERYGRLGDPSFRISTYRSGGFNAGDGVDEESKTIQTQMKLKIFGNSDHNGNLDYIFSSSVPYGDNLFFTAPGDINSQVKDLREVTLLEATPTPQAKINYHLQLTAEMDNNGVDEGFDFYSNNRIIKPGIGFIMGITHTFQMCGVDENGSQKYYSLVGGDFENVFNHTRYINETYPEIEFIGFNKATLEYFDYYTPKLIAWRSTEYSYLNNKPNNQLSKYSIRFIGKDILIDRDHKHNVSVKYPSYFMNFVTNVDLYKNGILDNSFNFGYDSYYPDINFTVSDSNDKWYVVVNQSRNEFPYIVSNYSSNKDVLFLNISSSYNFLKMNLILTESMLKSYNNDYNLRNIISVVLILDNGTIYPIRDYLFEDNELVLSNITIQESIGNNQLRIFFNQESSCSVMLGLFEESLGSVKGDEDYDVRTDLNKDGIINLVDVSIFASNFGDDNWCSKQLNKKQKRDKNNNRFLNN